MKTIDIQAVKNRNQDAGRFFFSPDTMRFFHSRPGMAAYQTDNGAMVAFVDSICQDPGRTSRVYSVRFMDWRSSNVASNRRMDYPNGRAAHQAAAAAIRSYDELSEAGAELIMADTQRRAWFAAYGLPNSCYVHVHHMDSGSEFHVFSVDGEAGEFTPERAGEAMQSHMWTEYQSDL